MYAAVPSSTPTPVIMAGDVIVGDADTSGSCRTLRLLSGTERAASGGPASLARPKSSTFTVPSGRSLMLAGLRSRWMIPCSWAASSASAISLAMGSASSTAKGPCAIRSARVGPSTSSSDQRVHAGRFLETVDRRDVRMIERREELRFAPEARQPLGIDRKELGKNLQRDIAPERRVARTIHLAHTAGPKGGEDFVRAETSAGCQGHPYF